MIIQHLHIDKYDWVVHCYIDVDARSYYLIMDELDKMGAGGRVMKRVSDNLMHDKPNTGFTFSSKRNHETIMVISYTTSNHEMLNTISHEIRHLCDDIADECGVPVSGEEVAYLTGSVTMQMYGTISKLVCDCPKCRRNNKKMAHP